MRDALRSAPARVIFVPPCRLHFLARSQQEFAYGLLHGALAQKKRLMCQYLEAELGWVPPYPRGVESPWWITFCREAHSTYGDESREPQASGGLPSSYVPLVEHVFRNWSLVSGCVLPQHRPSRANFCHMWLVRDT